MSTTPNLNFVDPVMVVNQLGIAPGATVADFGCGTGYFSFECARHVGSDGLVYALDVLPAALEAVTSHAKMAGISNIIPKRVNLENEQGSGLGTGSVDWVILKDILFQNQKKDVLLREVARVLKSGGQGLIMEWSPEEVLVGPDKGLRLEKAELQALISQVGLSIDRELAVGGFHYAFVVKK